MLRVPLWLCTKAPREPCCYIRLVGFLRRHPLVVAIALVFLTLLGLLIAAGVAVWRAAHVDEARRVGHADVILVLGAAQYNGRPSSTFEGRLRQAENLYRKGFSERVLVLGGNRPGDRTTEAEAGTSWLVANGLPGQDVSAEPVGNSTLESLRAAAAYMRDRGMKSAFLVSDPWHNLRIRKMARDLGIQAYVSATWHSAAKSEWTRLSGYSRETFAYLYYRVLGK
jgi:vancomycin permeability regulator SanA